MTSLYSFIFCSLVFTEPFGLPSLPPFSMYLFLPEFNLNVMFSLSSCAQVDRVASMIGAKKNNERPILVEAIEKCKELSEIEETKVILLCSELSRLGRNAFEVLDTIKTLVDYGINLYLQKEQMTLLDDQGKPSLFAPIMLATLSTCAQLERENITFRLNSGRRRYIESGGRLGRPKGSIKTSDQKIEEYKEVITLLRKNYTIRDTAKLSGKSVSSVQRVKKLVNL